MNALQFLISSAVLLLCFNLKAVIAVGIWLSASRGHSSPADQSVKSHQRDGNHRYCREEDDDGKHPVWVGPHISFRE